MTTNPNGVNNPIPQKKTNMEIKKVKVSQLKHNIGQVQGLPSNPRYVNEDEFKDLVKSIKEDPEMMEIREIIAYDNDGELVVIGGNQRLEAVKYLKKKTVTIKLLPKETTPKKLRAYAIKDNVAAGKDDWDIYANEWDLIECKEWGVKIPDFKQEKDEKEKDITIKIVIENNFSDIEENIREELKKIKEKYIYLQIK
jgi:ParB-like chromosome segregation protein Spo0J